MMQQPNGPMGVNNWNNMPSLQNISPNVMTPNMQPQPIKVNMPTYFVNSANDIRPGDVSQDGAINLFISRDLKTIYARSFNPDITISAVEYTLKQPDNQPQTQVVMQSSLSSQDDKYDKIISALETLTDRVSELENKQRYNNKKNNNNYQNNNPKKEGPQNEQ